MSDIMNNFNQIPEKDDHEIDLLDLFIVLLKYRWMLISLFLGAIILVIAGSFIYPSWQYHNALENSSVDAKMTIAPGSILEDFFRNLDLKDVLMNAPVLQEVLKDAGYVTFGPEEDPLSLTDPAETGAVLNLINHWLIRGETVEGDPLNPEQKKLVVENPNNKTTLIISFKDPDEEKALAFMKALYKNVNSRILEIIRPDLIAFVEGYESMISNENPTEAMVQLLSDKLQGYKMAKDVLEKGYSVVAQVGAPYTINPSIRLKTYQIKYIKLAVIIVIAVFFLSIFLAFLRSFVDGIKKDEQSMTKIRKALEKHPD